MVRVVALRKAVTAGIAGAIAMELVALGFHLARIPAVDFVGELIPLAGPVPFAVAYAGAFLAHLGVGICWAVFYGYFFWARLKWPPPFQGIAFALMPALLAIFVVYPQLRLMQSANSIVHLSVRTFLAAHSVTSIMSLIAAHAAFGLVMGSIYTKPVGYRADRLPRVLRTRRARSRGNAPKRSCDASRSFMFATGIECSYPTIEHGSWRRDEMRSTRHYVQWERDFELAREVGISHIRYGPPLHLVFQGPGHFEWSYCDPQMEDLHGYGPEPIIDLCHFGLPSWLGDFQNPDIPNALADYAGAFAERYPWVRFYTPVNEMYVCARISALQGFWNEQKCSEQAFVNAVFNLARASVAMSDAILTRRPEAVFINSESSEFYQPCCPDPEVARLASFENERRFLPLDLIYGHEISDGMRAYLAEHGVADSDLAEFSDRDVPRRSILGVDYYEWNERLVDPAGRPQALGELFGWYVIADQYYRRYRLPMMHTETNRMDADDAPRWLWRQWHNVQLLQQAGVPLVGFTWYSLIDQIDWGIALREALGIVHPVGLFDLNREARAVGLSYKHLIELYRDEPAYRDCRAMAEVLD
jgi:beta-glucosidase/6-phospho-beta-glucosidase/beta-galactosidase